MIEPKRGHIYRMEDPEYGRLHCLAIAVQSVPGLEGSFLAVRVTLMPRRVDFSGWVRLSSGDPCGGYIVVHDLDRVEICELADDLGMISMPTLNAVERSLKWMLGL